MNCIAYTNSFLNKELQYSEHSSFFLKYETGFGW